MLGAFEDDLVVLSTTFRLIFQVILWPLVIVGVLGNAGVLCRICFVGDSKACFKPFYRCSLLSLALSDLLLLGSSGTNVLVMVGHRTLLWRLSDLSCTVIPYLQTVAVLVASLNLAGVALDRYTAIRTKCPMSKGPGWLAAISVIGIIWAVAAGASYPVLDLYTAEAVIIINNSTIYTGSLCVTDRHAAATVYTAHFAVIFIPLAVIFVLVHGLLALSIYKRKSPTEMHQIRRNHPSQMSQDNSTASTSVGTAKASIVKKKALTSTHMIRKRRTVRVILILIVIFAICRIPQWTFLLVKLHVTTTGNFWWHLQVILTALTLLNAAVHPFLYAFLNEALSLVAWFHALCCVRRESMTIESNESKEENREESCTISVKVPRSPYSP